MSAPTQHSGRSCIRQARQLNIRRDCKVMGVQLLAAELGCSHSSHEAVVEDFADAACARDDVLDFVESGLRVRVGTETRA